MLVLDHEVQRTRWKGGFRDEQNRKVIVRILRVVLEAGTRDGENLTGDEAQWD